MILELTNIQKNFSSSHNLDTYLLKDINMSVETGSVTALIGGNGTGKTTLFNIISGFEKNFSGHVIFNGKDISKTPAYQISRLGIGRMFQGCQLMSDLTLMENMVIAGDRGKDALNYERPLDIFFHNREIKTSEIIKEQKAIDILTKLFGKDNDYLGKLDKKASTLSYGQQRLIALVRLLMGNYPLILLDEPTSGINPEIAKLIRNIICTMVNEEGLTVLMIEHNMTFVRSIADTCHYLADGIILKSGRTVNVLNDPDIQKKYLGL